ncbi:MAG: O-antigen ligase family protein, partial [Alphaproteobacteria bacterium]|nr:O-antigen ligase family protein [Alphaproteobacteria bacterium]
MIPLKYIDNVLILVGFAFLVGSLNASLTTFDSSVGGANSSGNLNIQVFSMAIYVPTVFLILYRIERFLGLIRNNLILFLFFLIPLFSIFWSIVPELSARRVIALTGTTLFISYTTIAVSPERAMRLLAAVFGITAISSLVFALALPGLGTHEAGPYVGVWRGVFAHKNRLGGMMVLAVVTIFLCPKHTKNELIAARIGIVTAALLIIMSQSKTALLIFLFLTLILPVMNWLSGKRSRSLERAVFVLLFGIIFASLLAKNTDTILEFLGKDITLTGRTGTWQLAWDNIHERPILGHGYRVFWSDKSPGRLVGIESWRDKISHSHNTYLDLMLDFGFFGFVWFLLILAIFLRRVSRILYFHKDSIAIWMLAFAAYMIVVGITEKTVFEQSDVVWAVFILSVFYLSPRSRRETPSTKQRIQSLLYNQMSTSS